MKLMDSILKWLAVFLLLFILTMIVIFCIKGEVPDTLITCVFGACTGEISIMGWIKTTKEKNKKESEDDEQ